MMLFRGCPLPTVFEREELRLEVEVAMLCDELRRVHG